MGLSASQGRMLLLTARKNDLEFRAQQISQRRLVLSSQLEQISTDYEEAMSNRVMHIKLMDTSGETASNKEYNLTYAALVSGTVYSAENGRAAQYGLVASGTAGTKAMLDDGVYSTTNYRLVNADGYIVVASEDEIPTKSTYTKKATDYNFNFSDTDDKRGFKTEKKEKLENNDYVLLTDGRAVLYGQISDDDKSKIAQNADKSYHVLKFNDSAKAGTDSVAGLEVESRSNDNDKLVTSYKLSTLSGGAPKTSTNETVVEESVTEKDNGGKENIRAIGVNYTDKFGNVQEKTIHYVIDPSLVKDSIGADSGSNYLQECLRNGLYSIQKGTEDRDDEDNDGEYVEWRDISWDSATSIYDQYYDDDDAAAKAKYDRLQTQIQNQDKKLELELNNIETQRSAVTTEVESVQKVIDDNVDSTFKTFA